MLGYLSKILLLFIFSLFVIHQYYFQYNHIENFDGYFVYLIIIGVIYWVYKYLQINNKSENVSYSFLEILWFAWLHLFILSGMFFYYQDINFSMWLILFSKIIFFLILPFIFSLISLSIWKKILSYIVWFNKQNLTFQNVIWLVFWFFLILTTITIVWMIGVYNIYSVIWILLITWYLSINEIKQIVKDVLSYSITFSKSEWYGMRLLSTEFLFILSTLLLSVNLINAFRPFPIWWDDLWAYMNYAQLLAQSGEIFNVTSMFSWQIFTWIWYIFNSPTQAFFLNNLWWILSFVIMIAIFSDLLRSKTKDFFINIPLLLATIFIAMPMFIFEQAKDMKLDPGLYFVSIACLYLTIKLLLNSDNYSFKNKLLSFIGYKNTSIDSKYIFYIIIWIIAGFAFTIKFTSLLLISGLFALLFYARLWILALFWYLSIYFAIFTKFWLWKMMNVSYPSNNIELINNFSLLWIIWWITLLLISFIKNKDVIKTFFIKLCSVFTGIIIALLPWLIFNYSTANNSSLNSFLLWKYNVLELDYLKIHTQDNLDNIRDNILSEEMSSSWTTANEDLWRYFWYEEGINNYIKLPWNLSMQVNQKWEFTDITYIYLALFPLILLFLPFRNRYLSLGVIWIFIISLLLFIFWPTSKYLTSILSLYTLPGWYILLFAWFVLPLIYLLLSVKDSGKWKLFKYIVVFSFFYVFLWLIAAYGIVWYWIVMYFCFLLIIGICLFYISWYDNKSEEKEKQLKLLWSLIILIIIAIYFFASSIPHAFINLKSAAYKEFKSWDIASIEAPYMYHKDYLRIIYELNIEHNKKDDFVNSSLTDGTKKLITLLNSDKNNWIYINIQNIDNLVLNLRKLRNENSFSIYHNDISKSLKNIYEWITYPSDEYKNTKSIYRIWTFLKYYISENTKRIFEDALIIGFDSYLKWWNPSRTIENMSKLWLNYFLVDLNAATIDRDPRKNLTKRYEWLLRTFTSDRLEFVSSDSICFRLAREWYMKWSKDIEWFSKYMTLAWVNYNSYNSDWSVVTRQDKLIACYNEILTLIQKWKVNNQDYAYLLPIQNYIINNKELHGNTQEIYKFLIKAVPHGYKVLFRIKE